MDNAPKTTYDFYACFLFGGSIKVTTGFPIGTADKTLFLSPDTSSPGIHSKKSVVIEFDNYRVCPDTYINKLKELRYIPNTLGVYNDMFEEFINYYEETAIYDITEPMIMDFLRYLVTERHVSTSYQNQSINAIKFYFERVLGG